MATMTTALVTVPGRHRDANSIDVHVDQAVARKGNDSGFETPRFVAVGSAKQEGQRLTIDSDGTHESSPTVNGYEIAVLMGFDLDHAKTISNVELESHRL